MFGFNPKTDARKPLSEVIHAVDNYEYRIHAFICNNLGNITLLTRLPMYEFYRLSDIAERGQAALKDFDRVHAFNLGRYILGGLVSSSIQLQNSESDPLIETKKKFQDILGKQPYVGLQPIVANLRTAGKDGSSLRAQSLETSEREGVGVRLWLGQKDILWIVDGQHRRMAIQMVIEFLEEVRRDQKYPPKSPLFPKRNKNLTVPEDELAVWSQCLKIIREFFTISVEIHLGLEIHEEAQLFYDLKCVQW